uniref:Uncharacterized protein n=1 Tax=Pseudictyota dubia TaxID=2749911 RepID=A0A7R9WEU5_9STRA|mmetsp:Transcript_47541/g.88254  ORF Transcript_47541/g.88254 Transcript_47541/m.88254 type:complete len:140 (+) Transcript_47541:157-576(+)|eukprot:CAMPEP_0197447034 /NCGR_PEP_ID=MMETSP1175-20131217/11785_1 /TAXON_ID=1003142 /ORGANISM="Triceratium dubium, Strain CCMP147" /LENGTH=139 /DNA_ID=CAMNT_0042978215 /DNA_START=154 /DNA_END=573 /DNA_ORIENTATION=-
MSFANKLFLLTCVALPTCFGWVVSRDSYSNSGLISTRTFLQSEDESIAVDKENPCWQDIYDDDCSMSTVYSASFVATEWIKSMPCAAGIEDCDMPDELRVPFAHDDPGIEDVDVMGFLQLKRAAPIKKKSEGDSNQPAP